jgi:muramidase (phage lysozyme)
VSFLLDLFKALLSGTSAPHGGDFGGAGATVDLPTLEEQPERNVHAFGVMTRKSEGLKGDDSDYSTAFDYRRITSLADHPREKYQFKDLNGEWHTTSAAGAYQAETATWDDFTRAVGPRDFSKVSQDEFFRWCVTRRGAMADVKAGRLRSALFKCAGEWASFPTSTYPQGKRSYEFEAAAFEAAGGIIAG